jgi:UDP-N-acetylmuramoylalanine--D-glutamate ligase
VSDLDLARTLVVGLGVTGRAVAESLLRRGHHVVLADDRVDTAAPTADALGLTVSDAGDPTVLEELVRSATAIVPSPGVPRHHRVYWLADEIGRPIVSELDLAALWDERPVAAITGTNGKTTVTTLVTSMLRRSGVDARDAGNTDVPLVEAIDDPDGAEMFVVEASSFRLERVERFAPKAAAWLNLAPDHLDWHGDLASYGAAKARIWSRQGPDDVAVAPVDDLDIAPYLTGIRAQLVTFGEGGDVGRRGDLLIAHGEPVVEIAQMARRRPHDLANASAATAVALAMGADRGAVADELRVFSGIAHRLETVATVGGVTFHNDSKATAPHATLAALSGFDDAVLIAGGRNKDLDLGSLAEAAPRLRAVVAIGEAAGEVTAAFRGVVPVEQADDMEHAVSTALRLARPGGDVVLSPACASFDWYRNYRERGDHFRSLVRALVTPDTGNSSRS